MDTIHIAAALLAKFRAIALAIDFTRRDINHALHAGIGVAYPYGNSTVLPFEKRYFSGQLAREQQEGQPGIRSRRPR